MRRWRIAWRRPAMWFRIALGLGLLLLGLGVVVCEPYHIPSRSMEDTLLVGDFLLVEKLSYGAQIPFFAPRRLAGLRPPQRGDIVVFRHPSERRDYIKRCVALAGDRVEIRAGALYVNGQQVDEPYCKPTSAGSVPESESFGPLGVPAAHVFVLGDHRGGSRDSRDFGALPVENLRGRALLIYYSWDPERHRVRWQRIPLSLG